MSYLQNGKLLVTGATGFIGSALIKKFIEDGLNVTALARSGEKINALKASLEQELNFIKCRLDNEEDIQAVTKELGEFDILVHLASHISGSRDVLSDGEDMVNLEIKGTLKLLKFMNGLKQVCYLSSMAVFGAPSENPVKETTQANVGNVYGICKLTMEKFFQIFSKEKNIPVSLLRPSSVYGPGNTSSRAIPTFIQSIIKGKNITVHGDGKQLRDYVYVDDVVEAIKLALNQDKSDDYNIGAGTGCSTTDLLKILTEISEEAPPEIEYKALTDSATTFDFVYDISKARRELGFEPETDLKTGLKLEYEWHKKRVK